MFCVRLGTRIASVKREAFKAVGERSIRQFTAHLVEVSAHLFY
jgi:hypothetical protein